MLFAKAFTNRQCQCERIAERQRRRRARGRHEVHRTRLFGDTAIERDVRSAGERGAGLAGQRDRAVPRCVGWTRCRRISSSVSPLCDSAMHHVVFPNRAEIAMNGFGRVQEPRGRARARERGRDLPADDPGLAHARDNDAAAALEQELDGPLERSAVEAIDEAENG